MTIPNSVTSLGSAFPDCEALTSVTVDTGNPNYSSEDNVIYTKDKSSLVYCMTSKKGQFVIPNSVTSIGSYAFSGSRITTVIIPNSVTSIGSWAFNGCSGLTSINIPNSVTRIKDGAFAGCSGLASITIPNSVTSIEGYTFSSCSNLTSITIPNSVTSIGNSAFSACISLTSYTIPNSVTSIGNWAFSFCVSLTDITIPNSVTTIRDWAFGYCYSLKNVTCYATESPETNSNAFDSAPISSATLYVPEASIEKYRNIGPWSEFETILAVEDYHTDLSKYDNIVYIDDVTARTGGEVALSVKLKNKDAVYGYEFKLELPAGATVVTTTDKFGDTEIQASMTEVRTNSKRHTFSTSLKNGILTVLCYSTEKKAFTDNDGEVAQIKITLASGIEPGTYPIKITNEAISLESSTPVIPLVGQSLTVTPRIVGDVNGDGKVDILDLAALISHLNGSTPPNFNEGAADVDNSGSLSEADITTLSKLILGK